VHYSTFASKSTRALKSIGESKKVTIGNNLLVGARSVVTKYFPDNVVADM